MENQDSLFEKGLKLPLVEAFYTLQGEGFHTGKAAYFIRIGGCDVGCSWCDTKFSWNPDLHPLVEIGAIVNGAVESGAKSVVVTGGEPLSYPLEPLCRLFKKAGLETFLETSGAYELAGFWDWVCLSPKKTVLPCKGIHARADELKMIIHNREDFEWAEKHAKMARKECKLYLQPEWSKTKEMIPEIIDYIKGNQQWAISLQAHKYIGIP